MKFIFFHAEFKVFFLQGIRCFACLKGTYKTWSEIRIRSGITNDVSCTYIFVYLINVLVSVKVLDQYQMELYRLWKITPGHKAKIIWYYTALQFRKLQKLFLMKLNPIIKLFKGDVARFWILFHFQLSNLCY